MKKNKTKNTYRCILTNKDFDTICDFYTRIKCGTDVVELCKRFKSLYKIKGVWQILKI